MKVIKTQSAGVERGNQMGWIPSARWDLKVGGEGILMTSVVS